MMVDDGSNGRVTLAVLQNEITHIRGDLQELRADLLRYFQAYNSTTQTCSARVAELERLVAQDDVRHDERWRAHNELHARENGLTALLSTVSSAIAAIVGIFVQRP